MHLKQGQRRLQQREQQPLLQVRMQREQRRVLLLHWPKTRWRLAQELRRALALRAWVSWASGTERVSGWTMRMWWKATAWVQCPVRSGAARSTEQLRSKRLSRLPSRVELQLH